MAGQCVVGGLAHWDHRRRIHPECAMGGAVGGWRMVAGSGRCRASCDERLAGGRAVFWCRQRRRAVARDAGLCAGGVDGVRCTASARGLGAAFVRGSCTSIGSASRTRAWLAARIVRRTSRVGCTSGTRRGVGNRDCLRRFCGRSNSRVGVASVVCCDLCGRSAVVVHTIRNRGHRWTLVAAIRHAQSVAHAVARR